MNDNEPIQPATPNPPISSSLGNQPQDTLLQRGAFDPPATPGTLGRLNRFEIIRLVGEGGMGQVYLAREPLTDTQVAIKILRPQLADDPHEVHRFLTEARHMYRLSHPRILRVLEVSDRKEGPYYVMPYIAAGNLRAQSQPGQPLPDDQILSIARQVAEALAHAHAHGLIHRDITPGNVLLDKEGNAYLTDFGLVRTVFNDSMVDTTASHLEGTTSYMSPAVARGEAEDTRCDIYAFGAVLYELLTGQPPYTGRTNQMILDQIIKGPPLPIRQVNPKANPALAKIAEGCMARELRDRYASMADVVTDLASAAKGTALLGQHQQRSQLPKIAALLVGALVVVGLAAIGISKLSGSKPAVEKPLGSIASPTAQDQFTCTTNNGEITIAKYTGPGGDVTIPRTIKGLPVTTIGGRAFRACAGLTSINIPSSITNIGAYVHGWASNPFNECGSLIGVTVDAANPVFISSADGILFNKEKTFLVGYPGGRSGSYVIPDGVTTIGEGAFSDCSKLDRVAVPGSVKQINFAAFSGCNELTGVYFKGDAPNLAWNAFIYGATNATIYYRPGTTGWGKEFGRRPTAVWEDAEAAAESPASAATDPYQFSCTASNGAVAIVRYTGEGGEINIPATISGLPVTSIQNEAFLNCANVTSVTIPNSITSINSKMFEGCTRLADVKIPDTVTSIGDAAFLGCTKLTHVKIPASVNSIGGTSFFGCSGLVSILVDVLNPTYSSSADGVLFDKEKTRLIYYPRGKTGSYVIPKSVTSIGWSAFQDCSDLTSITIPDSVASIGGWAFCKCPSLTRVDLPASVIDLGVSTFIYCGGLTSIVVNASNPAYSSSPDGIVFNKDRTRLVCFPGGKRGSYTIPSSVTEIGPCTFQGCDKMTEIVLPANVTSIGNYAFYECFSLTGVTIPDSVTRIGENAFAGCIRLTNVMVGNRVTGIGDAAFAGCAALTNITVPDSVTAIGDYAFHDCINLTTITTPDSVTRIGIRAFAGCTKLTNAMLGKRITGIEEAVFAGCAALTSITIPNSVTSIANWAFGFCTSLTDVKIPDSVTQIGGNAFQDCARLTSVLIGRGVTQIEMATFQNCPALTSIAIPNSVTGIGDYAFHDCFALGNLTIPDSVTRLGVRAFAGCIGLTNITWGNLITVIEEASFAGCPSLASVTIPEGVIRIGSVAFAGCSNLVSVWIPNSVTNIEGGAFERCVNLASVYFKGNAPGGAGDGSVFADNNKATVYYLPGTTGWGKEFGGRPTAGWEAAETKAGSAGVVGKTKDSP